jgi:hypothetical protein
VRRPLDDLVSTRRSRSYYIDGIDEPQLMARLSRGPSGDGYYEHMLIEDVGHLLPFGHGLDDGFSARFIGDRSAEVEDLLCAGLPTQYEARSLGRSVEEFLEHAAQLVVGYEPPTYEVDYLHAPDSGPDDPVAFRLDLLQPGSVDRIRGRAIQYVPSAMAEKVRRSGLGYVELEADRLVTFSLSPPMARDVGKAVRFLQSASRQQSAEFALMTHAMQERTNYDSGAHHRISGELVLKATRSIGWSARGLHREHVLDPYSVWRGLRFKAFRITVRDQLLLQLNEALASIGRRLGFSGQVELVGVPQLAAIEAAEADLIAGRRTLSELMDLTY